MRASIVAGNWKMNTDRTTALALVDAIIAQTGGSPPCEVIVCPPFVSLDAVSQRLAGTAIQLGAQHVYFEAEGAYAGEVSTSLLRSVVWSHLIVGHSARRSILNESDDDVARTTNAAIDAGLIPIVCVGETLEERDGGHVEAVVGRQIDAALRGL